MALISTSFATHNCFDVFLSFPDSDTLTYFPRRLYDALGGKRILKFIHENDLEKGEEISARIEGCRCLIIIFSENYTDFLRWLDELEKIMKCSKSGKIVPIFHHVEPSNVRKFGETFRGKKWRSTLRDAANLCGWNFPNQCNEAELIKEVADDIMKKVNPYKPSLTEGAITYDVFLSFRGSDTRNNFTRKLYKSLCGNPIHTFIDEKGLEKGEDISSTLMRRIAECMCLVIVFSKNYATSSWCLDELEKIMECSEMSDRKVVPIFYHVERSDVENQEGEFGKAFKEKKEVFIKKHGKFRVQEWCTTMRAAANPLLIGWNFTNHCDEAELMEKVAKDIVKKVNRN